MALDNQQEQDETLIKTTPLQLALSTAGVSVNDGESSPSLSRLVLIKNIVVILLIGIISLIGSIILFFPIKSISKKFLDQAIIFGESISYSTYNISISGYFEFTNLSIPLSANKEKSHKITFTTLRGHISLFNLVLRDKLKLSLESGPMVANLEVYVPFTLRSSGFKIIADSNNLSQNKSEWLFDLDLDLDDLILKTEASLPMIGRNIDALVINTIKHHIFIKNNTVDMNKLQINSSLFNVSLEGYLSLSRNIVSNLSIILHLTNFINKYKEFNIAFTLKNTLGILQEGDIVKLQCFNAPITCEPEKKLPQS